MSNKKTPVFVYFFLLIPSTLLIFLLIYPKFIPVLNEGLNEYISFNLDGVYNSAYTMAEFHGEKVDVPGESGIMIPDSVLNSPDAKKRIEVDLTNQKLKAFVGNLLIYEFDVSTGKWGRTPTGDFKLWSKYEYILMTGGSKEINTYYYLPNVPYTMFFYNEEIPKSRGYGIHGTYWHDNFGHPMSHGCINMKTEEAKILFDWAYPKLPEGKSSLWITDNMKNTPVRIYGIAPIE